MVLCHLCERWFTQGYITNWLTPPDIQKHADCIGKGFEGTNCHCGPDESPVVRYSWLRDLEIKKSEPCRSYGNSRAIEPYRCDLCCLVQHFLKHQEENVSEYREVPTQPPHHKDHEFQVLLTARTEYSESSLPGSRLLTWRAALPYHDQLHDVKLECVFELVLDQVPALPLSRVDSLQNVPQVPRFDYDRDCLSQAVEWLEDCMHKHICSEPETRKAPRPARLIDLGADNTALPFVCETTPKTTRWMALSYCWGGDSQFVLNQHTLKDFESGIPLADFPPTIQDAITIARKLRMHYLWVDALCILQDSEEDWSIESAKMQDIYKGAALTLIVANAASVNEGILPFRFSDSCDRQSVSLPLDLPAGFEARLQPRREKDWPIRRRAWTFQEELLSTRTLTYSRRGMAWSCLHGTQRRGGINDLSEQWEHHAELTSLSEQVPQNWASKLVSTRFMMFGGRHKQTAFFRQPTTWMLLVQAYSQRRLAKDKDLLPALGALALQVADHSGDKYVAGVFRDNLLLQMTWIIDPAMTHNLKEIDMPAYRAPSFSWASVKSNGIRFECDRENPQVTRRAKVVKCSMQPLSRGQPYGQIKDGFVVLKGQLFPLGDNLHDPRSALFPAVRILISAVLERCPGAKQEYEQRLQMYFKLNSLYLFELFTWSGETESVRWPYRDSRERYVDRNEPTGTPNRYIACLILGSFDNVTRPGNGLTLVRMGFLRLDQGDKERVMRGMWGPSQLLIPRSFDAFNEVEQARDKYKRVEVKII